MLNTNFVYLAAALNLIGSSSYVIDTVRGKTQPNRVTWFLWALTPLIAFSAMLNADVGIRSLTTFMVGFGPLTVFIASFVNKNSFWKVSRLDAVCGIISILALILWRQTSNPHLAITFAILADGLASIPTVFKSYKEPETESYNVYFFGAISALITLLTIEVWTFAAAAFPVYIFLVCSLLFVLIFRRQGIQLIKK